MIDDAEDDYYEDEFQGPSKSQVKRELLALQKLGEDLSILSPEQRRRLPASERLLEALAECDRIKAHGARKRQLRFIGKLMQSEDSEAIAAALALQRAPGREQLRIEKEAESWRERFLDEPEQQVFGAFLEEYPQVDRSQLRQLIRSARAERDDGRPPAQQRKLLRFVRDVLRS